MKTLTTLIASLALVAIPALSDRVAYDTVYDNKNTSLTEVSCSDGPNGLIIRGYSSFGSLPNFPYIGAAAAVAEWDSPKCGTCWELTYTNPLGVSSSINVLAIDHAGAGFNIALSAMNNLTNGQALTLGHIEVASKSVAPSTCGLGN